MNIRRRTIILWYNKHKPTDVDVWHRIFQMKVEAMIGNARKPHGRRAKRKQKNLEQFGEMLLHGNLKELRHNPITHREVESGQ